MEAVSRVNNPRRTSVRWAGPLLKGSLPHSGATSWGLFIVKSLIKRDLLRKLTIHIFIIYKVGRASDGGFVLGRRAKKGWPWWISQRWPPLIAQNSFMLMQVMTSIHSSAHNINELLTCWLNSKTQAMMVIIPYIAITTLGDWACSSRWVSIKAVVFIPLLYNEIKRTNNSPLCTPFWLSARANTWLAMRRWRVVPHGIANSLGFSRSSLILVPQASDGKLKTNMVVIIMDKG